MFLLHAWHSLYSSGSIMPIFYVDKLSFKMLNNVAKITYGGSSRGQN